MVEMNTRLASIRLIEINIFVQFSSNLEHGTLVVDNEDPVYNTTYASPICAKDCSLLDSNEALAVARNSILLLIESNFEFLVLEFFGNASHCQ
jgi:hypothetical protein